MGGLQKELQGIHSTQCKRRSGSSTSYINLFHLTENQAEMQGIVYICMYGDRYESLFFSVELNSVAIHALFVVIKYRLLTL